MSNNVTLADGARVHKDNVTEDTVLGTNSFQIPNTVYMAWFGEVSSFGKIYMSWTTNQAAMRQLGFNVVTFDNDSFPHSQATEAKAAFLSGVDSLSNSKSLHGIYMMGHGNAISIGSEGWSELLQTATVAGPIWSVYYNEIDQKTNYKLGALVIQACESDGASPRSLVSTNGFFVGQSGTYIPFPVTLPRYWGVEIAEMVPYDYILYRYGSLQKTSVFESLRAP